LGGAKSPFREAEGGPEEGGIPSYPLLLLLFSVEEEEGGKVLNDLDVDVGERGGGKLGRRVGEVLNEVRRGGGAAKGSSSIEERIHISRGRKR